MKHYNDKVKLLFFSFELPPLLKDSAQIVGGAAVQWNSWIYGFRANGHRFGLLTWKGAKAYINKDLDFDIVECYDPHKGISKFRVLYYQIPSLIKAIRKYNPDYLIQGSATAHTGILMFISKLLGIKFIHRIANDADVDERISSIVDKREIKLYLLGVKYSDFIFTQNTYQLNKLKEKYPSKKIFLLHNPYESKKNLFLIPKTKRNYIAWVGNFRYIKNISALVNIARKFPNVIFKIAGAMHTDVDDASLKAIKKLKTFNNVEFVGYLKRNQITDFLKEAILLLNTSFYEGFSNTFLEAWSCGTPVVSTINANPDNLVDKFNLGKVAKGIEELPNLIGEVISLSLEEYTELSKNCQDYVQNAHDPKVLAKKFVDYLLSSYS